jgi:hypothetical protein
LKKCLISLIDIRKKIALIIVNTTWVFRWNQRNIERSGRFGSLYRSVDAILFGKSLSSLVVGIMQTRLKNILDKSVKIVQREVAFVHQAMKTWALGCGGIASCTLNVGV